MLADTAIRKKCITVSSQPAKIDEVVSELINFVAGFKRLESFPLSVALAEAITNAIIHGNKSDPRKRVFAQVLIEPERVVFQIADEGIGFDYEKVNDPTKEENLLKQSGRGIFFMRYFMDEVKFNTSGNEITMAKYVK